MPNPRCTCGIGQRIGSRLYTGRDAIINCAVHGPKQKEIREKLRFPKKHEKIVYMVDGKPMELPPSLKRYMEERFGNKKSNFTIIRRLNSKAENS